MQDIEGMFCANDGTRKWGPETVRLGREMGGDQGKDLQRDAIYANEGVPPLADCRQRGCRTPVEPTNFIEGEAVE